MIHKNIFPEWDTEKPIREESNKKVQTSLVAFCYACQTAHIKEHIAYDKVEKRYYCKRTYATVDKDGFHPPLPVEADECEILDPAFSCSEKEDTTAKPSTLQDMVPGMLEDVLLAVGLHPEEYADSLQAWSEQIHTWMEKSR